MIFFKKVLDGMRRGHYKPAAFLMMFLAAAFSGAAAQAQMEVPGRAGVILPNWCKRIGEGRYKAPGDYLQVIKFFDKHYTNNPRQPIVNQPGVRGIHIVNRGSGDWAGLNVYEVGRETRIYIVPRNSERQ